MVTLLLLCTLSPHVPFPHVSPSRVFLACLLICLLVFSCSSRVFSRVSSCSFFTSPCVFLARLLMCLLLVFLSSRVSFSCSFLTCASSCVSLHVSHVLPQVSSHHFSPPLSVWNSRVLCINIISPIPRQLP